MVSSLSPQGRHGVLTIPNGISLLRLLIVPFVLLFAHRGEFRLAFWLFVFAAITDGVDGWLARRLNQRSSVGAMLDPAADKVMAILGFVMFTLSDRIPFRLPLWLTFTIFVRDFMIVVFAYLLFTRIRIKRFPPTISGKVSTVVQVVTLAAVIAVNAFSGIGWEGVQMLFKVALVTTLFSAFGYLRRAEIMLKLERAE
ncbi:MAG TPA: CDP-alcohol phosphatidyltransferase family protein [Thermoanaerobaculia bacterium]|nr:CDP-alcohol phosphatidyltransferase family protein [Thermoanaerobaculia bacterium]